jgi:hypothetical protein
MKEVSEQEQEALLNTLRRHERELKAYPGVHYVDVGYKFENGEPTDVLAIRVHLGEKKPESEVEPSQVLPRSIEEVPVDVIQSNPGLEQNRDARFDPLVGGIAVGNQRHDSFGTLGAVVFDAASSVPMGLSNHHIFVGVGGRKGDKIAQPFTRDSADVIGTLTRWNLQLDCAVCTLDNSREFSKEIVDLSQGVRGLQRPRVGMNVTKSGRTTGTTSGIIDGVTPDEFTVIPVRRNPPPTGEISAGGDSGSLWFVSTSGINIFAGSGVGLHFAGETTPGPNTERAWAKWIVSVATTLNIRF